MTSKKQLTQQLIAAMPKGAESVVNPDHPLLFRAPDLLSLHKATLTSYFVYPARESYITPTEKARVLLARLALPKRSLAVLAVEDISSVEALIGTTPLFDEVLDLTQKRQTRTPTAQISSAESTLASATEIIEELRPYHHERYADAWTGSIDPESRRESTRVRSGISTAAYYLSRREANVPREEIQDLGLQHIDPRNPRSTSGNELSDVLSSTPRPSDHRLATRRLTQAAIEAVKLDYMIDLRYDGLPEVASMLRLHDGYLAIHQIDTPALTHGTTFDPLKTIRAAAFAGLSSIGDE